jgi:hypothetical protein
MFRRVLAAPAIVLLLDGCALFGAEPIVDVPTSAVALAERDLAPAAELDVLMRRSAGGPEVRPVRIAVAPVVVESGGGGVAEQAGAPEEEDASARLAGAVTLALSSALARADGASVVDVREVAGRARARNDGETLALAREVGADVLVAARLVAPAKGPILVRTTVVQTRSGARSNLEEVALERTRLEGIGALADAVARSAELEPVEGEIERRPLGVSEALGRAWAAERSGTLLDVVGAYAAAIPKETAALTIEVEFAEAMASLGLASEAAERARAALRTSSSEASSPCERVSLLTTLARVAPTLDAAREAVASASVCADASKLVSALSAYAERAARIDLPLARESLRRAERIGSRGEPVSLWARCDLGLAQMTILERGVDPEADASDSWRNVASRCERAGNGRAELDALVRAAEKEPTLTAARTGFARAAERGASVFGDASDVRIASAEFLLREGDRAGADASSTAALREAVLAAVRARAISFEGDLRGLPARVLTNLQLDEAERTMVTDASVRSSEVGRALALRLGRAVEVVGRGTELEPDRAVLGGLAARLLADAGQLPRATKLDEVLARAKLPGVALATLRAAPLRASGHDARAASEALSAALWAAIEEGATSFDRVDAEALERLASWTGSELDAVDAACAIAWVDATAKSDGAPRALERARSLAGVRPSARRRVDRLERALAQRRSVEEAVALLDVQSAAARSQGGIAWIEAERAKARLLARDGGPAPSVLSGLVDMAEELASRGLDDDALRVLDMAAELTSDRDGGDSVASVGRVPRSSTSGSIDALRVHEARVRATERFGDDLRIARARADKLVAAAAFVSGASRSARRKLLARDAALVSDSELLTRGLRDLIAAGRAHEVATIVVALDPVLPGALVRIDESLRTFERPPLDEATRALVAALHGARGEAVESNADSRAAHAKARQLYAEIGRVASALAHAERAIARSDAVDLAVAESAACRGIAGRSPARLRCAVGMGQFVARTGSVLEPEIASAALSVGLSALGEFSASLTRSERLLALIELARLALHARDDASLMRLVAEAEELTRTQRPDAFLWAEFLAKVADAASSIDASRALELAQRFRACSGASDAWRAELYVVFARYADIAGDAEAEREFLDAGRELARTNAPELVALYDLHPVRGAIRRREWNLVERIFREAARSNTIESPANRWWSMQLTLEQAMARAFSGDAHGARAILEPIERAARLPGAFDESPALYTRALELLASTERTLGACPQAAQTTALAAEARARATERRCHGGWCETPDFAAWRAPNACRERLKPDSSLLFSW